MNEGLTSNSSFIEATRGNTLVAEDIRAKAQRKREKQADPDAPDEKQKAASFDDVYDGEWFVDAEDDEELQDTMLAKHGFRRPQTDAVLLCPGCFSALCNLCQQHEVYQDQYRALIVTDKVRVSKKNTQRFQDETGAWFEHWTAYCRSCDVEVGNYDPLEQMYHFYSVLPSR